MSTVGVSWVGVQSEISVIGTARRAIEGRSGEMILVVGVNKAASNADY